jgi:hypothetical protein
MNSRAADGVDIAQKPTALNVFLHGLIHDVDVGALCQHLSAMISSPQV